MDDLPATSGTLPATQHTNPAVLYLARLATSGRCTMQSTLQRIAIMLGVTAWQTVAWEQLRYEHMAAIRMKLTSARNERGDPLYKPTTVNKYLACLRGVAKEAWKTGQMDTDTYTRIRATEGVTGETLPVGRALGMGEIAALMRACAEDTPAAGRDAAIIALAYAGGLRRAELAGLTWGCIIEDNGETISLKVVGKRSKERMVYLENGGAAALRAWLQVRGGADGALFYAGRRGGHITDGQGMTAQAVRDVVGRRALQAGLQHASPHDLRRSFVSDLLDHGVDIATVADMAGHANIGTTRRYDRRGEHAKRKAAKSLLVPYYG
jgi:site-specific recombinase XerD